MIHVAPLAFFAFVLLTLVFLVGSFFTYRVFRHAMLMRRVNKLRGVFRGCGSSGSGSAAKSPSARNWGSGRVGGAAASASGSSSEGAVDGEATKAGQGEVQQHVRTVYIVDGAAYMKDGSAGGNTGNTPTVVFGEPVPQ